MKQVLRSGFVEDAILFTFTVCVVMAARMWLDNLRVIGLVRVDAALIALPLLSTARGTRFGIITGFLLGLIVDATGVEWMGSSSVGYALVGFLTGSFGQSLYMEKSTARGILVFGAVIFFDLVFGLLSVGIAHPFWLHALGTLGSAVLSGVAAALITRIVHYWRGRALPAVEMAPDG